MQFSTPLPIVPVILMLASWVGLYLSLRAVGRSAIESFSIASVGWAACNLFLAELLSRIGHLSHGGAVLSWSTTAVIALSCAWILQKRSKSRSSGALDEDPLSITERVVIALFVLLVGATGLVGLATPIMDWDAQHYHIPRVLYWVQNGSIEHYATANPRQLFMGPWPAFVQLHTYLLAGSDRLANMVQWACMVGSLILAGAIARQLGGRRAAGLTAVALVATLPMGIMQASTALTDYVTAFWVLVLMFLGLQTLSMVRISKLDQLALGGALGFAVLTKGTAVPIVAPFVIAWVGVRLRRRLDGTWQAVTVALLAALIVNATHFARNLEVFGHITGPEEHRRLVLNESYDPKLILSNLVRHPLVHIGTDDPDQAGLQLAVSNFVHRIIGVTDGDPRNSHLGQALHIAPLRRVDFLAGNPAHLMLYLTCGLWLIVTRFRHANARLLLYSACLLAAAVMFVAMFKYQHTISRLHLPIFVVAAPWCAVIMAGYWSQRVVLTITLLFLSMSVPWVVFAERRPLLGSGSVLRVDQEDLLYNMNGTYRLPARAIAREVDRHGSTELGLITQGSSLEYFLWHELNKYDPMPRIIILVPPEGLAPRPDVRPRVKYRPRFVAWLRTPPEVPDWFQLHRRTYRRKRYWRWGPESLYEKYRPRRKGPEEGAASSVPAANNEK